MKYETPELTALTPAIMLFQQGSKANPGQEGGHNEVRICI